MNIVKNNSEILFIYDAKTTNPNGDMDNENRPRMIDTDVNIVTDLRLKRYLRDYFEGLLEEEIFITNTAADAKDRGTQLKKSDKNHRDLIDVRMFGAVFASSGANDHITGPIQFNLGYSLNSVEEIDMTTTSTFNSGKGIGNDCRVKYSVIAFQGSINANIAVKAELTNKDVNVFDKAMVNSIPFCRTRSKIGQTPRIYLRVELNDNKTFLNDLREYISFKCENSSIKSTDDYEIGIVDLVNYLTKFSGKIEKIHYWKNDKVQVNGWEKLVETFNDKLQEVDNI